MKKSTNKLNDKYPIIIKINSNNINSLKKKKDGLKSEHSKNNYKKFYYLSIIYQSVKYSKYKYNIYIIYNNINN